MSKGTVSLVFGLLGLFVVIIISVIEVPRGGGGGIITALSIIAIISGLIGTIKESKVDRYLSIVGLIIGIIEFIIGLYMLTLWFK